MTTSTLITAPIFVIILTTFALNIIDIAQESSDETLKFAQESSNAMECAYKGIGLEQCSPELFEKDFKTDLEQYKELNQEMLEKIKKELEAEEKYNK